MKRIVCFLLLCAMLALGGCGAPRGDFFDVFRGGYTAEVTGTLYGMPFSAKIEMAPRGEEGTPPATVTFYAPSEIGGTVLTRAANGTVTLSSAGLTVGDMGGVGAALFSLFPTGGAVRETTVDESGHTLVLCEGVELAFLPDGTPYSVKTADVTATVVKWQ